MQVRKCYISVKVSLFQATTTHSKVSRKKKQRGARVAPLTILRQSPLSERVKVVLAIHLYDKNNDDLLSNFLALYISKFLSPVSLHFIIQTVLFASNYLHISRENIYMDISLFLAWENSWYFATPSLVSCEITSEERRQKFHTDDVPVSRSG